jgi:hypothetical protein
MSRTPQQWPTAHHPRPVAADDGVGWIVTSWVALLPAALVSVLAFVQVLVVPLTGLGVAGALVGLRAPGASRAARVLAGVALALWVPMVLWSAIVALNYAAQFTGLT